VTFSIGSKNWLIRSVVTIYRYDRVTDAIDPKQTYNRPYETVDSAEERREVEAVMDLASEATRSDAAFGRVI